MLVGISEACIPPHPGIDVSISSYITAMEVFEYSKQDNSVKREEISARLKSSMQVSREVGDLGNLCPVPWAQTLPSP